MGRPVDLDGVLVHYFPVPRLRRLCWCPAMQTALKRDIGSFDVVHLHSVFLWPTWAAARAARAAGIPYLVAPRGMLGATVISRKSRWVKSAWIRCIEQRTLREAAGVHVTAELERKELQALGLELPRIFCVPNGVSWPERHTALAAGPFADVGARPYALFLGRIDPKKGLDRLLAAWKWIPDLMLIIAGNDEDGYRAALDQIAADKHLESRIRFIGPVSDEHKWALYEHAAMFVLPSYFENFGNTVAEAMAMGCPVVVTPEVGLAPLVQESGAGIVVDGAPRTLAEAVRALLQDSTKRRTMGERGRLAARQHLSWQSAASRTESIYQQIRPSGGAVGSV
jgi:glycosyltransferase involved in cell wall biosynthesis